MQPGGAACPAVSGKDGGHSAPAFQQRRGAFCPPGPPEGIWIRLKHDGRVFPSRM